MTSFKQSAYAILLVCVLSVSLNGFSQNLSESTVDGSGIYCNSSTTWNGISWSNGSPDYSKDVIFTHSYSSQSLPFQACSIFVLNGAQVNFSEGSILTVAHAVNVEQGGHLLLDSGSNLIQTGDDQNSGKITITRESAKLIKDDYTLWSSPVSGQRLLDFSPETLPNRFYYHNTQENIYNTVQNPATTTFDDGKSYLIRTGENHPTTPQQWTATFEGTANNGDINVPLSYFNDSKAYNAVGNPYPSPISITKFFEENSENIDGTIWLWRKTTDPLKSSYATVTKLGYQSNTDEDTQTTSYNPYTVDAEGILNVGQGFIVKAKLAGSITFSNAMRKAVATDIFFRTMAGEDNPPTSRFWLNMTAEGVFSQVLVGYTPNGTMGIDSGLDGESIMDGGVTLYTIADSKKLSIQARPAFSTDDSVPLGYKSQNQGVFTIALDHKDGIFSTTQEIFIKDAVTGAIHDFADGPYSFSTQAGVFENRFSIVYSQTLSNDDNLTANKKLLTIYNKLQAFEFNAIKELLSITLYDMSGREIYTAANINNMNYSIPYNNAQILVAKVVFQDGTSVIKKLASVNK